MNIKQTYQNCDDTEMTYIQKQTKKTYTTVNKNIQGEIPW